MNKNHTRILAFKNKTPALVELFPKDFFSLPPSPSKSSMLRLDPTDIPELDSGLLARIFRFPRLKAETSN